MLDAEGLEAESRFRVMHETDLSLSMEMLKYVYLLEP